MSKPIRVILADDHIVVLQGLKGLLQAEDDLDVVALAQNGNDLLECLERYEADVVVMDLEMPYHGFKALEEIRRRGWPVRVVVLTAFGDGDSIQSALELGAEGFALKTESPIQLIEAIRQVASGRLIFPRSAQRWLTSRRGDDPGKPTSPGSDLSSREWEVLAHASRGATNTEIALQLGVSENTVRFHLKNIYAKINVTNRTEAAGWFFENGGGKPQ
ncbi:MAG TPA: response regulator transcription factor [Anaerolineales bacterium]|nr:response regulator transcription factor [Anaerolineales bacterium]